jgi:MinD superfamily P-loop ATPase
MKELVVISGKGGTGKTSIVGSFAALSQKSVLADCNVGSSELPMFLASQVIERHDYWSGYTAVIHQEKCIGCGACYDQCRFHAIIKKSRVEKVPLIADGGTECRNCTYCVRSCSVQANIMIRQMQEEMGMSRPTFFAIDPVVCEGCGVCAQLCPAHAIEVNERLYGKWLISETRLGLMVHATLDADVENSDKLVTLVRKQAKKLAENKRFDTTIVNGPSGTGYLVNASIVGADMILIVTESTRSGLQDLERMIDLANHFSIPAVVCINKWDINPEIADEIEHITSSGGSRVLGKIRYDNDVMEAQLMNTTIVEYSDGIIAQEIKNLWNNVMNELD